MVGRVLLVVRKGRGHVRNPLWRRLVVGGADEVG